MLSPKIAIREANTRFKRRKFKRWTSVFSVSIAIALLTVVFLGLEGMPAFLSEHYAGFDFGDLEEGTSQIIEKIPNEKASAAVGGAANSAVKKAEKSVTSSVAQIITNAKKSTGYALLAFSIITCLFIVFYTAQAIKQDRNESFLDFNNRSRGELVQIYLTYSVLLFLRIFVIATIFVGIAILVINGPVQDYILAYLKNSSALAESSATDSIINLQSKHLLCYFGTAAIVFTVSLVLSAICTLRTKKVKIPTETQTPEITSQ